MCCRAASERAAGRVARGRGRARPLPAGGLGGGPARARGGSPAHWSLRRAPRRQISLPGPARFKGRAARLWPSAQRVLRVRDFFGV